MARTWYVYGLAEPDGRPEPGLIRYVGKTERTPKMRLREHMCGSIRRDTYLGRWLRKLRTSGLKPQFIILEQGTGDGVNDSERWHISWWQYSKQLVNHHEGGNGARLLEGASGEVTREKVRSAAKAHFADLATRQQLSERMRTSPAVCTHLKRLNADPVTREKQSRASQARWADPANRDKARTTANAHWSDPAYRQKNLEHLKRLNALNAERRANAQKQGATP